MRKTILLLLSLGAGSTAMASDALPDPATAAGSVRPKRKRESIPPARTKSP